MRLLVALAFVAVASAATDQTEEKAVPVLADTTLENQVKTDTVVPTAHDAAQETVKIAIPTITEAHSPEFVAPTLAAGDDEISPVKVVESSADPMTVIDGPIDMSHTFQIPSATPVQIAESNTWELPLDDPEAMRKLFPDPSMLIDISPAFVPDEVVRQMAKMGDQDVNAVNIGGAHPFSFNNAEPLDVEPVMVADNPVDELDSKMDPVMVVQSNEEQSFFGEVPKETIKVVDKVEILEPREVPRENWRGPASEVKDWRIPVPQDSWMFLPPPPPPMPMVKDNNWRVPPENWRGPPPPMPMVEDNDWRVPPENWRGPPPMMMYPKHPNRPYVRPAFFRDVQMPREGAPQYNMPLPAYNDPALR